MKRIAALFLILGMLCASFTVAFTEDLLQEAPLNEIGGETIEPKENETVLEETENYQQENSYHFDHNLSSITLSRKALEGMNEFSFNVYQGDQWVLYKDIQSCVISATSGLKVTPGYENAADIQLHPYQPLYIKFDFSPSMRNGTYTAIMQLNGAQLEIKVTIVDSLPYTDESDWQVPDQLPVKLPEVFDSTYYPGSTYPRYSFRDEVAKDANGQEVPVWNSDNISLLRSGKKDEVLQWIYIPGDGRYYVAARTLKASPKGPINCEGLIFPEEPPTADQEKIQAFVERMYQTAFGRAGDNAGVQDWTNWLISGKQTGTSLVQGFFLSKEYIGKNKSNEAFIKDLYRAMFDREADKDGMSVWMEKLENGMSANYIINGFSGSTEFINLCSKYGILPGALNLNEPRDQNAELTAFVARLYTKAMERDFDTNGLNDWCRQILNASNQRAAAKEAAHGFVFSSEFINKQLTDEKFIETMYRTFMDRAADAKGLASWMDYLGKGHGREEVFYGFANSVEFDRIMTSFGI